MLLLAKRMTGEVMWHFCVKGVKRKTLLFLSKWLNDALPTLKLQVGDRNRASVTF